MAAMVRVTFTSAAEFPSGSFGEAAAAAAL
jgi:hypothetical protein